MDAHEDRARGGLRIGELAELGGTTPRAIRHYHAIGLLAEPGRDASGYRRYGPAELVRLVRIRRLRSVGMPTERIGAALAAGSEEPGLDDALHALADELATEIERLAAMRERVLALARSQALAHPAEALSAALGAVELPVGEQAAANLVDALHPGGIAGAIEAAAPLLADRELRARLDALLRRFAALPPAAGDAEIEALASELAAVLPRPERPPASVDVETMDALAGPSLSPAQRRCLRRLRELLG